MQIAVTHLPPRDVSRHQLADYHITWGILTGSTAMALIEVEDLRKTFKLAVRRGGPFGAVRTLLAREHRLVHAVDGISFRLDAGEMVGYIGPNGAGKSTTIKMLTGILVPTSGRLVVDGRVPHRQRVEDRK